MEDLIVSQYPSSLTSVTHVTQNAIKFMPQPQFFMNFVQIFQNLSFYDCLTISRISKARVLRIFYKFDVIHVTN